MVYLCVRGPVIFVFLSFHRSSDEQNHLVIASVNVPNDDAVAMTTTEEVYHGS